MAEKQNLSQEEQEIRGFLKQLRKWLMLQKSLWYLALYGLLGAVFALLCNLLSLWIPIYAGEWIGFAGCGVFLLAGAIHWLCCLPKEEQAAVVGDQAGLEERLITSLEGRGKSDLMSSLQRQDTAEQIRHFQIAERLPLRGYPRWYAGMGVCLALALCCALYPTEAKKLAKERHALSVVKKVAEKQLEQVDQKLEEQADGGDLQETERKKLREILQTAKKEIADSQSTEDIRKAKDRLETKLVNSLPKDMDAKTAQNLQSLVQNQDLTAMADYQQALDKLAESSDTVAGMKQELQSLGELLGTQQKQALINQLNQALADGNITQQELSQALQNLNDANASYTQTKLAQAEASSSASGQTGAAEQSGTSAGRPGASAEPGQSGEGQNGQNGSGQRNGSGNSNGNGNGSGEGSGNGSGNGTGNSSGSGSGSGTGNGNGSGHGGGYSAGSEQGIERKEQAGEAEQVWIPEETGDDENLTGQKMGSSSMRRKSEQQGTSRAGSKADLGSVSGSYEKKAYSKIQKQKIPDSMEDMVKEYFSSLD